MRKEIFFEYSNLFLKHLSERCPGKLFIDSKILQYIPHLVILNLVQNRVLDNGVLEKNVVCKSIFHFLHAVYCKNISSVVSIGFVLRKGKLNIWKHGYHHKVSSIAAN